MSQKSDTHGAEPDVAEARWSVRLLRAGRFKLDGGSMFGLIPRTVWSRSVQADDRGRITVQHNCLLLDRLTPGDGPKRVLVECGTGNKLDAKMREVFDLEDRWVGDALAELAVTPESIDAVVVTHLHFDHAGGLTRLPREGENPDWKPDQLGDGGGGSSQRGGCCLSFPNAHVYVQHREWLDALANRSVMTRTYYRDHLEPMRGRLRLVDSPRPFPVGLTPDREQLPPTPADLRMTPLWRGSGLGVMLVPGHTWGQQAVVIREGVADPAGSVRDGRTIVFTPDVMPTAAHLGAAYSLAYDVEPYTSMISKRWLLTEAAERGWTLCLDHEPGDPFFRAVRSGKPGSDWFELTRG